MAAIRIIFQGNQVDRRDLGDSLVIGRGEGCDMRLGAEGVSRAHCRIERRGGEYAVVDLGSRNGTLVDGARVTRRVLRDGDLLRVGNYTVQFESPKPAPRTLDDEVLEMLNDVAPSPSHEWETVGAAIRGPDGIPDDVEFSVATVQTQALAPDRPSSLVRASARSLWDTAIGASVSKPAGTRDKVRDQKPGASPLVARLKGIGSLASAAEMAASLRRRVGVPSLLAAAAVATVIVYLIFWQFAADGPRFDPKTPLHHQRHARSAD